MKAFITGVMLIEYVYRIGLVKAFITGVHRRGSSQGFSAGFSTGVQYRGSVKGFIENFILLFSLFHMISMFYRKLYIILMQK